jgi:hypothetical protein
MILRPALTLWLHRHREELGAGAVALLGLWVAAQGGLILIPLGLLIAALGGALALNAWRRGRFAQGVRAPGVVELDEGQVGYLSPDMGGYLSLQDLVEIRLLAVRGARMWRLKQRDGQAILIPVEAEGAERLFDAFANLPGLDATALLAALQAPVVENLAEAKVVWRRARHDLS